MSNKHQGVNSNLEKEVERLQGELKAEKERRASLEQELKSISDSVQSTRETEKQFLANMSHEIRNPIHAVIGLVNLLYDTKLTPEQFQYLNNIKYSTDVLMSLISGILDLSKIEAGNIELNEKEIDITEVIKAVVQTYSFKSFDNDIQFNIDIDDRLKGLYTADPMVINQIFLNLLSNAVKFTEKGKVEIGAILIEEQEKNCNIQFTVRDTGIGIPENQLSSVFEAFKQGSLETKLKYGGTGLGLSIVKNLISMYGGKITVESEKGKGSTFIFNLKLERMEYAEPDVTEDHPDQQEGPKLQRILIVEDNKINQQYLTWLLEKWHIEYDIANHGEEALDLTEKVEYDLILMDIRMPVMDGYETTIRLRNHSMNPNKDTPIIALTASALVDEKDKATAVGMNYHLSKPFSPEQLRQVLNKLGSNELKPGASRSFRFSEELNSDYLNDFYGNDIDRAGLMFNIFLKNIDKELLLMNDFLQDQSLEEFASLAHKIKPNFAMVGVPELTQSMKEIELLGNNKDFSNLKEIFPDFLEAFKDKRRLIASELKRLDIYLENKDKI